MNLQYAGTIPLCEILEKLGLRPASENGDLSFYPSPFNYNQPNLSLEVHNGANTWRDLSTGRAGGPVELVKAGLVLRGFKSSEVDVLSWFRVNISYPSLVAKFKLAEGKRRGTYELVKESSLKEGALVRFAMRRGLTREQAKKTFKEVEVRNIATGKEFRALGLRNEDGGYAIFSSHVDALIGPMAISFIRGREWTPTQFNAFRSIFDYLDALKQRGNVPFDAGSIILHSYACADDAATYLRGYGYTHLYTWFDEAERGSKATEAFAWLCSTDQTLKHVAIRRA
jgi:hypothetical protein